MFFFSDAFLFSSTQQDNFITPEERRGNPISLEICSGSIVFVSCSALCVLLVFFRSCLIVHYFFFVEFESFNFWVSIFFSSVVPASTERHVEPTVGKFNILEKKNSPVHPQSFEIFGEGFDVDSLIFGSEDLQEEIDPLGDQYLQADEFPSVLSPQKFLQSFSVVDGEGPTVNAPDMNCQESLKVATSSSCQGLVFVVFFLFRKYSEDQTS